ncbi:hypothetical protein PVAP13_2KG089516 [Panicum virgatum]|uniref:Uncharacterized protein n=1 Tax=Panicum virgatum TaxID=38727 RepID=A0A8T0W4U2_PANVG|nr:hypothetical protein PVAP13_2KG089516 [Panicum virgatum]
MVARTRVSRGRGGQVGRRAGGPLPGPRPTGGSPAGFGRGPSGRGREIPRRRASGEGGWHGGGGGGGAAHVWRAAARGPPACGPADKRRVIEGGAWAAGPGQPAVRTRRRVSVGLRFASRAPPPLSSACSTVPITVARTRRRGGRSRPKHGLLLVARARTALHGTRVGDTGQARERVVRKRSVGLPLTIDQPRRAGERDSGVHQTITHQSRALADGLVRTASDLACPLHGPCRVAALPAAHARALRAAGACTRDPDRHNTLAVCSEQTGAHPATLRTWPQDGNARAERWWCAGSVRALAGRVAVSRQPPSTGFPFRKGAAPYHAARIHTARPASGGAVRWRRECAVARPATRAGAVLARAHVGSRVPAIRPRGWEQWEMTR